MTTGDKPNKPYQGIYEHVELQMSRQLKYANARMNEYIHFRILRLKSELTKNYQTSVFSEFNVRILRLGLHL